MAIQELLLHLLEVVADDKVEVAKMMGIGPSVRFVENLGMLLFAATTGLMKPSHLKNLSVMLPKIKTKTKLLCKR